VITYASATTTRRNLHELHVHGWRLLFSAPRMDLWRPGWRYALDNGAWTAFSTKAAWDEHAFRAMVETYGAGADWVVAPDVVAGGLESLRLSERWLPWLADRCRRVLVAVQDGMVPADLRPIVGDRIGIAIGGSTEWKLEQLGRGTWAELDCWRHALRVNTVRRISMCSGLDSFDGSSPSRFALNTARLTGAARQLDWRTAV
jgi:hypothetical protein